MEETGIPYTNTYIDLWTGFKECACTVEKAPGRAGM